MPSERTLGFLGLLALAAAVAVAAALANNLPISVCAAALLSAESTGNAAAIGLALGAFATPQGSLAMLIAQELAGAGAPPFPVRRFAALSGAAVLAATAVLWGGLQGRDRARRDHRDCQHELRHDTAHHEHRPRTARMSPPPQATPIATPLPGGQPGATVTLQPLLCAEMLGPEGWFQAEPGLKGALRALGVGVRKSELIRIPIVAFLIEHPGVGPILIDTGFHRAIAEGGAERNRNLGPLKLLARNVRMDPAQAAAAQLRARGVDPADLRLIVMTHLHFDHASALAEFPGATVLVSQGEWRAARARGPALHGYSTAQLDPALEYRTLDLHAPPAQPHGPFARALDLFGDGSLMLLDTPGHSAGHLAVLLRLREREALIAGDSIYTIATLREGKRPWRLENSKDFEDSVRALQAYDREHPDALIIPGHDIGHWESLAAHYA